MKKLSLAVAGVMLFSSLFAFTGCDFGGTGVVSGNYKFVTYEEATQAIEQFDMQNAFGDFAQESKVGFETQMDFSVKMDYSSKLNGETLAKANGNSKVKANIKVVSDPESEVPLAGKGSVSLYAKTSTFEKMYYFVPNMKTTERKTDDKSKVSGKVYLDSRYLYLDGRVDTDEEKGDVKVKYALQKVLEEITGRIDSLPDGTGASSDLKSTILSMMLDGYYVALDQSSGLKIRITANRNKMWSLLSSAGVKFPNTELKDTEFSSEDFAFYLSFDKNGRFREACFHINVKGKAEDNSKYNGKPWAIKTKFRIKGGMALKPFNGTVTLPDSFDGYFTKTFQLK